MRARLTDLGLTAYNQPAGCWCLPVFECSSVTDITSGGSVSIGNYTAGWVLDAAKRLEALGRLRAGWDSYGGLPLNPEAKRLTLNVMGWLGATELPVPNVALGSSGSVNLEWQRKGKELEVGLGRDQGIEFLKVGAQGELEEGAERDNLSEKLRDLAAWLLHE